MNSHVVCRIDGADVTRSATGNAGPHRAVERFAGGTNSRPSGQESGRNTSHCCEQPDTNILSSQAASLHGWLRHRETTLPVCQQQAAAGRPPMHPRSGGFRTNPAWFVQRQRLCRRFRPGLFESCLVAQKDARSSSIHKRRQALVPPQGARSACPNGWPSADPSFDSFRSRDHAIAALRELANRDDDGVSNGVKTSNGCLVCNCAQSVAGRQRYTRCRVFQN
jgi:hypothetical protein